MRGEVCVGFATILSFTSMLLLIFVHVGQINTSSTPRSISMANINMSMYGQGLAEAFADPIGGLYTTNASAPLQDGAGLRQLYKFGLYSHCAYVNGSSGICSNQTIGNKFEPYNAITSDLSQNYSQFTAAIIVGTGFNDSGYLGSSSKAAYWMILLGAICAAVAMLTGLAKHTVLFVASTSFAMIGSLFLLIGAAIWTVDLKKAETINNFVVGVNPVPLGIDVTVGVGLYLLWAAFAILSISIIPYMISCCTYRG